jgi:hypothetical protein
MAGEDEKISLLLETSSLIINFIYFCGYCIWIQESNIIRIPVDTKHWS